MTRQELETRMTEITIKFRSIRYGFRTLKSYNYIGFTKRQALDSINEEFKKLRDEYIALTRRRHV